MHSSIEYMVIFLIEKTKKYVIQVSSIDASNYEYSVLAASKLCEHF